MLKNVEGKGLEKPIGTYHALDFPYESGKGIRMRMFSLLQSQKVTKHECSQRNHHVLSKM
jgi:hypothetical protein